MSSSTLRSAAGALLALLLLPVSARAQTLTLTLPQALAHARERAPTLLEEATRVEEARGTLQGARALLSANPTLDVEVGRRTAPGAEAQSDWAVGLSQTLELGGKRGARRAGAEAGVAAARAARADAERRLLGLVAEAFFSALHAREAVALAEDGLQAAEALARATEARAAAGEVAAVEVNLARMARARAHGDVALARAASTQALGRLQALLGLGAEDVPDVQGSLQALALAPLEGAAAPPPTGRPDLLALEAEVAQADAAARAARAQDWPDVTLGARGGREGEESLVGGGLSMPLPLFQRGRGELTRARAQAARARLVLEAAQRARDVELAGARAAYGAAAEAARALAEEAQPLAQENLSLSSRAWEAGEMSLTELLLVRRDALETRALSLTRLLEAAHARAQLATQLGVTP